jgi:hypothetical protein
MHSYFVFWKSFKYLVTVRNLRCDLETCVRPVWHGRSQTKTKTLTISKSMSICSNFIFSK